MSRLASVRFSDGELPEVMDVVRLASILALHGPAVLRKVTCENAARVYGFQV
jgi:hypothetical protein